MCEYSKNIYNYLSKISEEIAEKLALLNEPTNHQPAVSRLLVEILGYDTRAKEGLSKISEDKIKTLIPKAEGCLATLNALEKRGFFPDYSTLRSRLWRWMFYK